MSTSTRRNISDLRVIISRINDLCHNDMSLTNSEFSLSRVNGRYFIKADGKVIGGEFTFGEAYTYLRGIETSFAAFQENLKKYIDAMALDLAREAEDKDNKIHLLRTKLQQREAVCDDLLKLQKSMVGKTSVSSLSYIKHLLFRGSKKCGLSGVEAGSVEAWKYLLMRRAELGVFSFPPKVIFQLLPSATDKESLAQSCEALMPFAKNIQWALLDETENKKADSESVW